MKKQKNIFLSSYYEHLKYEWNYKRKFLFEGVKLLMKKISESKFKFEQDIVLIQKVSSYLYLAKIFKERKNDDFRNKI